MLMDRSPPPKGAAVTAAPLERMLDWLFQPVITVTKNRKQLSLLLLLLTSPSCAFGFIQQAKTTTCRPCFTQAHLQTPSPHILETTLVEHGFSSRILRIEETQLPLLAEVFDHGKLELSRIVSFQSPAKEGLSPRLQVQIVSETDDVRTVDMGQLTTVWDDFSLSPDWENDLMAEMSRFPVDHNEKCMERLYQAFNHRSGKSPLSKKAIAKVASEAPQAEQARVSEILRKVVKTGSRMVRLVDSSVAMDYLYEDNYPANLQERSVQRAVGALSLANDATMGGRFKRMPCLYLSSECEAGHMESVTVINGGWVVQDQSVRAGSEARKFVERSGDETTGHIQTTADERIVHRLECLAMGDVFGSGGDQDMEVDVRETLNGMDLPTNPQGAREALVMIGRWTSSNDAQKLNPWSQETLEAARWYAQMDRRRRELLRANSKEVTKSNGGGKVEGRADLTPWPCVCVDAKKTSFRDDALGIRRREGTGRKVVDSGSRWELLIHIADVSDIYCPRPPKFLEKGKLKLLREAAASRGASRYDLPLGPLHLTPPLLSKALSFQTRSQKGSESPNDAGNLPNRCVTMWVYLDNDGNVVDAGLERTLVAAPIALSYQEASSLLEDNLEKGHPLYATKAVLAVAEKLLMQWSNQQQLRDQAASERERRLSAKERIATELEGESGDGRRQGFQRTRAHRLVDSSLDLYSYGVSALLQRAKVFIPRASGSGAKRGGRVATAPLRRFIDGMAQRQALSALCGYGGPPMTKNECHEANKIATDAVNKASNLRASKGNLRISGVKQLSSLRQLQADMRRKGGRMNAIATGKDNEVVISGCGAIGVCRGVRGSLRPGEQVMVSIERIEPEKGVLMVRQQRR